MLLPLPSQMTAQTNGAHAGLSAPRYIVTHSAHSGIAMSVPLLGSATRKNELEWLTLSRAVRRMSLCWGCASSAPSIVVFACSSPRVSPRCSLMTTMLPITPL